MSRSSSSQSGSAWDYVRIVLECAAFVAAVVVVVRPAPAAASGAEELILPVALLGAYATEAIGIHAVFGAFLIGAAMPRPRDAAARDRFVRGRRCWPPSTSSSPAWRSTSPGSMRGRRRARPDPRRGLRREVPRRVQRRPAARIGAREAATVGILMNTRGLIEIVLLTVGQEQGLIDDRLFTLFALMAILTTLLTAPALTALRRLGTHALPGSAGSAPASR